MTRHRRDERARLFVRTAELQARSRVLAEPGHPFSQAEHDELRNQLHQHFVALTEFTRRCLDEGRWGPQSLAAGSLSGRPLSGQLGKRRSA
jgi:hypothetical protein